MADICTNNRQVLELVQSTCEGVIDFSSSTADRISTANRISFIVTLRRNRWIEAMNN